MPYLIGCVFTPNQGWRVKKCLIAPWSFVARTIAHRDGMLWVVTDSLKRGGQYVNPADLITSRNKPGETHELPRTR